MKITSSQLRQIIQEELTRLQEARWNTFMASRMEEGELEEQDKDGDGDKDFDDVRVARFVKGGIPKDKAIARVKKNPLGKKGPKS